MTYYLLSSEPSRLDEFKKRIPALFDALLISEEAQLEKVLGAVSGNAFFFVPMSDVTEAIKKWILKIREKAPHAKIIFITPNDKNAHDLKAHQQSPVGGDAYVHQETRTMDLSNILEALKSPDIVRSGNRLETNMKNEFADFDGLPLMKNHPVSHQIDELFKTVIKAKAKSPLWQSAEKLSQPKQEQDDELSIDVGDDMSTNEKSLNLDAGDDLEISLAGDDESSEVSAPAQAVEDDGFDLSFEEDAALDLGEAELPEESSDDGYGDIALGEEDELSLTEVEEEAVPEEEAIENLGELSFEDPSADEGLSLPDISTSEGAGTSVRLSDDLLGGDELSLSDDPLSADDEVSLNFEDDSLGLSANEADLSDDAKEKLKEIDAIMDFDATQAGLKKDDLQLDDELADFSLDADLGMSLDEGSSDASLDQPLVSDDLNLDSLNFSNEEAEEEVVAAPVEAKKKKKETKEPAVKETRDLGQDLKEISGAYSGEMERMQATMSNLRSDREELLAKIQNLEEDKLLQNRQTLSLRAELDEKKIELTIIRRKLNDELSEMKDRLKLFDEKRLILEEKNRILTTELDKAAQKNKIDVKKVQMRERELEQKLELLKSDAETQIRNRDLKILELKRKIDAMEFDMESISQQEKKSVESRFELEDKLDKAIKTLRNAITVLEDENERTNALSALKKNIDM